MTDKAILLIENSEGDWMGVYLDDDLVYQGHDIDPPRLLEIIGVTHTYTYDYDMEGDGHLPRHRHELKGWGG